MKRFRPFILTEAQDYDGMFTDIRELLPNNASITIKTNITWAKRTLKKNHRIVWYLRWIRLLFLEEYHRKIPPINDIFKNELVKYKKKSKTTLTAATIKSQIDTMSSIQEKLSHLFDSNITNINNTPFKWQLPDELIADLEEIEKNFYEKQSNATKTKEKVFLQLNKEWTWYDLETTYSAEEQRMMKHCGNDSTGTLLSLRQKIEVEGMTLYQPFLTFAYNSKEKTLYQMKGYKNSKPNKEFHPQIIKLLYDDRVQFIKIGTYDADNDFKITDIPDNAQEKLVTLKPGLKYIKWKEYNKTLIWFSEISDNTKTLMEFSGGKWNKIVSLVLSYSDDIIEDITYYTDQKKSIKPIIELLKSDNMKIEDDKLFSKLPKEIELYVYNNRPEVVKQVIFKDDGKHIWFGYSIFDIKASPISVSSLAGNYKYWWVYSEKITKNQFTQWIPLLIAGVEKNTSSNTSSVMIITDVDGKKPSSSYHKAITKLLRQDEVAHYLNDDNDNGFQISDLPKVSQLNLYRDKPKFTNTLLGKLQIHFNSKLFKTFIVGTSYEDNYDSSKTRIKLQTKKWFELVGYVEDVYTDVEIENDDFWTVMDESDFPETIIKFLNNNQEKYLPSNTPSDELENYLNEYGRTSLDNKYFGSEVFGELQNITNKELTQQYQNRYEDDIQSIIDGETEWGTQWWSQKINELDYYDRPRIEFSNYDFKESKKDVTLYIDVKVAINLLDSDEDSEDFEDMLNDLRPLVDTEIEVEILIDEEAEYIIQTMKDDVDNYFAAVGII